MEYDGLIARQEPGGTFQGLGRGLRTEWCDQWLLAGSSPKPRDQIWALGLILHPTAGPPAERPVWQKVRSTPKFTKPRCWHVDLVPKDPESAGFGELRRGRPPSIQGQVGLPGPW